MHPKPVFRRRSAGIMLTAIALSAVVSISLLATVGHLFTRDGMPLERLVVAERACSERAYTSERAACVRSFIAASDHRRVASR